MPITLSANGYFYIDWNPSTNGHWMAIRIRDGQVCMTEHAPAGTREREKFVVFSALVDL